MKNIILRMLGLDPETVNSLQARVCDLELTLKNLMEEATKAYNKSEQAIILYKKLDIDTEQERWWEKDSVYYDDFEKQILADNIKKSVMKDFIKEHPSLQERFVFHGGCLDCTTPIKKGCGECLGCKYANWGSGMPDLSSRD